MIEKINPDGRTHVQFDCNKEDVDLYCTKLLPSDYNEIPVNIRMSFEFGASLHAYEINETPPRVRVEDNRTLIQNIPNYSDLGNLPFWVSELIQNAHDAKWGKDGTGSGASKFSFEFDTDRFKFSHNGRPPQSIDYATNEISKMTKHSTSKAKQYMTEGEFGIGFKIWMRLFSKIRLSYGKCTLVIDNTQDFPTYDVEWDDDNIVDEFTIEALEPKGTFLQDFISEEDGLNRLFERSIKGMLVKPKEFEISIKSPSKGEVSISKNVGSESSIDGMQVWKIEGDTGIFDCPRNVLTYTKKIGELEYSEDEIKENLRQEIESDEVRKKILDDNQNYDIESVIKNTINNFDVTIAIFPEGNYSNAMYSSLFPIPGNDDKYVSNSGLCFVGKFALEKERKEFSTRDYEEKRNNILYTSFLETYFLLMHDLREKENRTEINISEDFYINLLEFFTKSGDNAISDYVSKIARLRSINGNSQKITNIISNLDIYPVKDGFESYGNLIDLRDDLNRLLTSENSVIKEWALEKIDSCEALFHSDDAQVAYAWKVDAWASHNDDVSFDLENGPEIDLKLFVDELNNFGITWPIWLKVPVESGADIEWMAEDYLANHVVSKSGAKGEGQNELPNDDSLLTSFESEIKIQAQKLGLQEYFVPNTWLVYVGNDHDRITQILSKRDDIFSDRVNFICVNAVDANSILLEICRNHPQEKAQLPFLFVDSQQDVVILESKIPESIVFQGEQTDEKYVVNYSTRKDYIQSIYKPKAKLVTNPGLDITHLYCHAEAQSFVDDYLQTDFNSSEISTEFHPRNDTYTIFEPICAKHFDSTPHEVRDLVSNWINRVPLVGSILKINSHNASNVFNISPPSSENIRKKTGDQDMYVITDSESSNEGANPEKLLLNPNLASDIISTTLYQESSLSERLEQKWREGLDGGRFAVKLRVVTFPSIIAEQIILNYSLKNCEKFLRSLNFNYSTKKQFPQYYLLHLGGYYRTKNKGWNVRRIRIIAKKLAPTTLAIDYGHEIMDYLESKSVLIGTLPKNPSGDFKTFLGKSPPYEPDDEKESRDMKLRTFPKLWDLTESNLSDRIFRFALSKGRILLPETVLYNSDFIKNDRTNKYKLIVNQLIMNNLEFMDNQQFPLVDSDLIFQWFFNRPKRKGQKALLIKLIEEISEKEYPKNMQEHVIFALEAISMLVYSGAERNGQKSSYLEVFASIEYENYIDDQNRPNLSELFLELLEESKGYKSISNDRFMDLTEEGFEDFFAATQQLYKLGERKSMRLVGKNLVKSNLSTVKGMHIYFVNQKMKSSFPLTTNKQFISETKMVFSDKNSVVLYPSEEETRFFESNYQDEFSSRELGKIIVNEADKLLNRFSGKLPKEVQPNQNFKSEYEFLRRLITAKVGLIHQAENSKPGLIELLKSVYNSIDVIQLDTDDANKEAMFPNVNHKTLVSNILIGPCGIGLSIKNGRLRISVGPYFNQETGKAKIDWIDDLFSQLPGSNLNISKKEFIQQFNLDRQDLDFFSDIAINPMDNLDLWFDKYHNNLLSANANFEQFFANGDWNTFAKTKNLIIQIRANIEADVEDNVLNDANDRHREKMYDDGSTCYISGFCQPAIIGGDRWHKVRLWRPELGTHQPVVGRKDCSGWRSVGNTLWLSPEAARTGEILEGWRLKPPQGDSQDFIEYLESNLESHYNDALDSDYLVLNNVVQYENTEGHADDNFNLKLHKLHALYIIAFNKYLNSIGE